MNQPVPFLPQCRSTMREWLRLTLIACSLAACANAQLESEVRASRVGAPQIDRSQLCADETRTVTYPRYPVSALRSHTEGWVVLGYSLDGSGMPSKVSVLDSSPKGVFEQSAIDALAVTGFVPGAYKAQCKVLVVFTLG